ncbi:fluoride efflux transporter CrcB [Actinomycetes bacterium KLBMP 9797]
MMHVFGGLERTAAQESGAREVALRARRPRQVLRGLPWDVIGVVAAGGAIGAAARYGIGVAWPTPPGTFPWATFTVNIIGCALIGVLMVLIEVASAHRLVRPFAGTGILGGFTTFSTYAVDIERLVSMSAARLGLLYMVATPLAALAAVWIAAVLTRGAVRRSAPKPAEADVG